ncbi:hydroxyacid dehydrogenase [Chryseobacterium sp. Leaf180]|uniref:NAD(P)-dependent alcohol dehydrogenase n=1 Tax=Chryseobacterium sp. Leaf180 TaxID=1736289 RepID=UPI0006F2F8D3|nr:NAD(P)-dependent alcohol dehydrogenase [Chryseobacterium sp. Leaf180]KQR93939.1 hydroxyacid dehydrogenase [Chryseobacterium sp. Leaf180]
MEKKVINNDTTFTVKGFGASGNLINGKTLKEIDVVREKPKDNEVLIEVLYCGVCHSDIHQVNNDWKNTRYPCVPGHEVVGKIIETGSGVNDFKTGQIVGVGCMIDSCQTCEPCRNGEEQFCLGEHGATMTYNGYFNDPESDYNTFGGYSSHIVVNKEFLLTLPDKLDLSRTAPILCAGITTYSPLKNAGVKSGSRVAIVGIGGLGHMAVQIAKAMGAEVTAITTKREKREEALKLGADRVLISEDKKEMEANELAFDFILITIPSEFDINLYVPLLGVKGSLVTVGLLGEYEKPLNNMEVAKFNRSVGGSLIGGIKETQEVLDFCAEHDIAPEVQMIRIEEINEAFDKIKNEEVRFRYVIDMAN